MRIISIISLNTAFDQNRLKRFITGRDHIRPLPLKIKNKGGEGLNIDIVYGELMQLELSLKLLSLPTPNMVCGDALQHFQCRPQPKKLT